MSKTLYEGDDVIVRPPGDIRAVEGYSGAFCKCGTVHIKTPKVKGWYSIKCPVCGKIIQLYCGKNGNPASMDLVGGFTTNIGVNGD